jgi:protein-tyrosine sulfotransferase
VTEGRNLFFIVGCQRSGTTMLESILNAHPDVRVIGEEERASYKYFFKKADLGNPTDELVGLRIPVATHELNTAVTWYEGARVLFVLRDPRDVVASMHVARAGKEPWIAKESHGEIERTLRNLADSAQLELKLQQLHDETDDRGDIRFGAFLWALKNRYIPLYVSSPLPTKIVRYEVLVTKPEPYLRQICDHLGLEWSDRLLEHGKYNEGTWGGTDKTDPIHERSVAAHKDRLTVEDRQKIQSVIQSDMEMLGYVELFD